MWTRRYLTQFIAGMLAYVLVLYLTLSAFNHGSVPQNVRVPVALLPMVPLVFVALAVTAAITHSDELQHRLHLEALAFAFAFTALTTLSYGFLEIYAGFPHLNMFSVWPIMAVFWLIGRLIALRRYA